jgi:UDP-N-acetylglucosamine--N-acetylmuramyl-(pentapeptide) pyrophosphoryl-undecaprenol N-acetylglucosamine transferase
MSIVLTGGGTGGHLAIIAAVKEHMKSDLIYIGSVSGQDKMWFENDKQFSKKYFLNTQSVVNHNILGRIKVMAKIFSQTIKVIKILKKENVKVVFSVGGFSAAPASFAAIILRIPLVIHEQNAHIGSLNKIMRPFAKYFICAYEKDSPVKNHPIKQIYFDLQRVRKEIKTILIIGGSQGAQSLNKLALKLAPYFAKKGIKIYHQAGIKNEESIKSEYKKLSIDAEVFGFSKDLPNIIAKSDFAIARAGASTMWELVANGLPAIFIPYPYAAGDHQYYNAKFLADKNLGWVIREKDLSSKKIIEILENINDISAISKNLMSMVKPEGAKEIAKLLESI